MALLAPPAHAQRVGASVIGVVTRGAPAIDRSTLTEGYLTQGMLVAAADRGALFGHAVLDLEGLTLRRGELTPGSWGEGYVDRRHPHTYLHEVVGGVSVARDGIAASLAVGRGFAPFGSDDPMVRPSVKYPSNHHLAQILERAIVVAAVRAGPAIVEASRFNGDEPVAPASLPNLRRVADSWALRATLATPAIASVAGELTASTASVRSPERRDGGGVDQHKLHASARVDGNAAGMDMYALIEWARTTEVDDGRPLYVFRSALAEGSACRRGVSAALRAEVSERPEELRLLDPYRSERPATDLGIVGISRWRIVTATLMASGRRHGAVRVLPFVEVAHATVTRGSASALDVTALFGKPTQWSVSVGARIAAGMRHRRMGRYGAAVPGVDHTMTMNPSHTSMHASSTSDDACRP